MEIVSSSRAFRTLGAAALIVIVPFPLAACAGDHSLSHAATSELRAASGADIFSEPAVEAFTVDTFTLTQPDPAALDALGLPAVQGTGSLQVSDGVITAADLNVSTGIAGQEVTFVLTEPLVLRREASVGEPLGATGVLTVGGVEHHDTRVSLTPSFPDADRAQLDLTFPLPDDLLSAREQSALPGATDHISATITYSAQE